MTWTVTDRGTGEGIFITSDTVGDTFTPNENDLMIFAANKNISTSFATVTGWGATWFEIIVFGTSDVHIWAARMGSSPGSDEVNITGSSFRYAGIVFQIAGAKQSGSVADLFVQEKKVSSYNPTSPLAIPTLSAYASATNLSLSFGGANTNSFTPQSGWTEINDHPSGNGDRISANYFDGEDNTHTVEGDPFAFRDVTGIGFEIAEEAVAAGGDLLLTNRSIANYQGMRQ